MKTTTLQWLDFAKADLLTCESTINNVLLTNIVVFHAQQTVEKCFKAIFEENGLSLPRIHDLTRLYSKITDEISFEINLTLLQKLDTVYTTSRYPSDLGIMPDGKPAKELAEQLYEFAKYIYDKTLEMLDD
jgi:HEPN domain-containing protein